MKKLILIGAILAAIYNISGCSSTREAMDRHQYDVAGTAADALNGADNYRQSNYLGALANVADAIAKNDDYQEEANKLHEAHDSSRFWAWAWAIVAFICISSGGKSKS